MATSRELGEQFNLGDANRDPGGGLLYAIRYSPEILEAKMGAVIDRLIEDGFEFFEPEAGEIGIKKQLGSSIEAEELDRLRALAEELSVIGDARGYQSRGWGIDHGSVSELIGSVSAQAHDALDRASTGSIDGKIDAYDIATMHIPHFVRDLSIADAQNRVLTTSERALVRNLGDHASFLATAMDGRHILIGR